MPRAVLLVTAFCEGLCVLLIEIVGARAMAPFFGTSLAVWTAQITATLLFLALGYRAGGGLSRRAHGWHLPLLFGVAGAWLFLYRFLRTPLMTALAAGLGVAGGSFASAAVLFGVPLVCLGAVSPVLIAAIDRSRPGAGSAAGSLFFINTLGGLAGGWATAFLVIPYLSVTGALSATGAVLLAVSMFWLGARRGLATAVLALLAAAATVAALLVVPPFLAGEPPLRKTRVIYESESSIGNLQVVDYGFAGHRGFLIDGISQDEVNTDDFRSLLSFTSSMRALAHRFAPGARRALVLGLGAGLLARSLAREGVAVKAVDVDQRIADLARRYFDLGDAVQVEIADGRTFLRQDPGSYDVVFLDVFAAESVPWHLTTVEAFREIRSHLAPGGVLIINTMSDAGGDTLGLRRMEAALLRVFPQALVFLGDPHDAAPDALTSATLVAGESLDSVPPPPAAADAMVRAALETLLPRARAARAGVEPATDEWSDVDYADAGLRARWRALALSRGIPGDG